MAFLDELRATQNTSVSKSKADRSNQFDWASNEGGFYQAYRQALQDTGKKPISYNDFTKKVKGFVGAMGVEDGKWTKEDFDAGNYDNATYDEYANSLMPALFGGVDPQQLYNDNIIDVFSKNSSQLTGETKEAYDRLKNRYDLLSVDDRAADRWSDDNTVGDVIANVWNGAWDRIGSGIGAVWTAPYQFNGVMSKDVNALRTYAKDQLANGVDMLDNYESYIEKYRAQKAEDAKNGKASSETNGNGEGATDSDSGDTVTFTLPKANDPNYKGFGQKIVDLGLATNKGLWGSDGDVQFYTKQLYEQGAVDKNGNLKIGVPIKLRRRR